MTAYLLSTDGSIQKKQLKYKNVNDIGPEDLNPKYKESAGVYMTALDDYFFLMHVDNDEVNDPRKSSLPVNKAIQKYFPNSPYVGDILFVKSDEGDNLIASDFDLTKVLSKWKLVIHPATDYLSEYYGFVEKDDESEHEKQCQCFTEGGKGPQCTRMVKEGSNFCFQHQKCKAIVSTKKAEKKQAEAPKKKQVEAPKKKRDPESSDESTGEEEESDSMLKLLTGLSFSVKQIANEFVNELFKIDTKINFSQTGKIYLTAVIEYLMAEILELSGNRFRDEIYEQKDTYDSDEDKITFEQLCESINADEELKGSLNHPATCTKTKVGTDVPTFTKGIAKVLETVHPDKQIDTEASRYLDKLIVDFMIRVANNIPQTTTKIDDKVIKTAIAPILKGELLKHAMSEGNKAITKYNSVK